MLGVLGAIPAIDVAVALVNRGAVWGFGAARLPALALRDGIPPNLRTLVAVPTLLTTPEAIEEQIERLEIHHLASPEGDLLFALLSDWVDSATEHAEGDEVLLAAAAAGIARLNQRYGPAAGGTRFLLLHRGRIWNEGEGCWLGWERKRGKLHELNRLLRGATDTTFLSIEGRPPIVVGDVRYVVTLDADTRLPRDTVRRLIGKMAHPLNHPRFDVTAGRVVEGYAVMQPRVTPSLPVGREGSLFQRTFSSMSGIDPYTSAVSDVYQDLFGKGSYAGKGIYDVDAFEAALADRVPDSTLLSHDLFEGVFASAALASDIEVVEEFPARYDVDALRHHRWARGDWQLLPWISGARANLGCRPPAQPGPGDRPVEDARQSAPLALGARGHPRAVGRMDVAVPGRAGLDPRHHRDDCSTDLDPRAWRDRAASCRNHAAQSPARPTPRRQAGDGAIVPAFRVSRRSGLADERCHHPHLDPTLYIAPASSGMGPRGTGDNRSPARSPGVLSPYGRRPRHLRSGGDHRRILGTGHMAARRGVCGTLDRVARHRALDKPVAPRRGPGAGFRR